MFTSPYWGSEVMVTPCFKYVVVKAATLMLGIKVYLIIYCFKDLQW